MSVSKWFYRLRGYLVAPPLIFALFYPPYEMEARFVWPVGIFLLVLGVAIRLWAQQHLRYRLKTHKTLTMTGPYQFVRNPIYIGNTLICLCAAVISQVPWLVPVTLFYCFGVYSLVVRYEESHLISKYREPYGKYMAEASRWVPKVRHVKDLGFINEYFRKAILGEVHCFLVLLPYILKAIIYRPIN